MYSTIDSARIINLKVVSKLKRGQKINTRFYRFTIETTSVLSTSFLMRWINGESRDQTIDALDSLVSSCVNQVGLNERENNDLVDQLISASEGIKNLAQTYKDDQTTCAGIEMILEKIKFFVKKHGKTIDFDSGVSAQLASNDDYEHQDQVPSP